MKFSKAHILILALTLIAVPLAAQVEPAHLKHCSLATLKGNFSFFEEATLVGDPPMRMVTSGIIRFDGRGNSSGESMTNVEGLGVAGVDTFTGSYAVNPDCTYSGELTGGGVTFHFVGTITGAGMLQEMRYTVTDPGWVSLGTVKRIQPAACTLASVKGSYALFGQGAVTAPNPPAPVSHVGKVIYDGGGKFSGRDTIMLNGEMTPDTFTGTYTVTEECMISVDIASAAMGLVHEAGWIVGNGKSREVHLIVTDPGFVLPEATRKQ